MTVCMAMPWTAGTGDAGEHQLCLGAQHERTDAHVRAIVSERGILTLRMDVEIEAAQVVCTTSAGSMVAMPMARTHR